MTGPDKDEFYEIKWCTCRKCYTMTTKADEQCCKPKNQSATHSTNSCVTDDPSFIKFVRDELSTNELDKWVTEKKEAIWAYAYKAGDNADYRRKAYDKLQREYATKNIPAQYQRDWKLHLPSCVKWHIRNLFSEADDNYTGYFPQSADLLELTVSSNNNFNEQVELITKVVEVVDVDISLGPLRLKAPCKVKDEVIRMGEVSLFAAFEAFVCDALRLCFDVGFSKMKVTEDQFIEWLENQAPKEKKTTHQRERFYKQIYTRFKLDIPERYKPALWIGAAPGEIFKQLSRSRSKRDTIKVMQTIIKSMKINAEYPSALEYEVAITKAIAKPGKIPGLKEPNVKNLMKYFAAKDGWIVVLPPGQNPTIKVESFQTLECLSNLFYGLRCIHAHGDAERTTKARKGVLKKLVLDDTTVHLSLNSNSSCGDVEKVKDYFKQLLEDAKNKGKTVSHDYCTYQTMRNFYIFFAKLLGQVFGCVVYYNVRQFNITSNGNKGKAFGLTIQEMDDAIDLSAQP